jgi:hypothetical protein
VRVCGFFLVVVAGCGSQPPRIVSVSPASGSSLWIHDPISVTFDGSVDPDELTFHMTGNDPRLADASVSISSSFLHPDELSFLFRDDFEYAGTLHLDFGPDGVDAAGEPFAADWTVDPWFVDGAGWTPEGGAGDPAWGWDDLVWLHDGTVEAATRAANQWEPFDDPRPGASTLQVAQSRYTPATVYALSGNLYTHDGQQTIGLWDVLDVPVNDPVVLAAAPTGAALANPVDGAIDVATHPDGGSWSVVAGASVTSLVGSPAIEMPAIDRPVVAFVDQVDATHQLLRVEGFDATWQTWAAEPTIDAADVQLAGFQDPERPIFLSWNDTDGASRRVHFAEVSSAGVAEITAAGGPGVGTDAARMVETVDSELIASWRTAATATWATARWDGTAWQLLDASFATSDLALGTLRAAIPARAWTDDTGLHTALFNGSPTP